MGPLYQTMYQRCCRITVLGRAMKQNFASLSTLQGKARTVQGRQPFEGSMRPRPYSPLSVPSDTISGLNGGFHVY